ncbi:Hydrolase (HAD superfamily) [Desulfosporosinus sp. I2]|uniref:bis(5'-nucleosyl)-tetraphosphatase (symmetrical) YqeK n=1 Tax=Desulfosporosinus sp. I2 TaxID=1617025 RepID=UPI0005ED8CE0|nr:bis(5'-nucleosyl)-tetraphosphatase (symmetrical) YqeK [Desulfosporosinus sp. I2]KJR46274.1 Hydrolase (HAD superfamily) [Desulfosporosinus sp. I2]
MQKSIAKICKGFSFSGDIATDAIGLLIHHNRRDIANHVLAVANQAQSLADRFYVDKGHALLVGLLHDISLVVTLSEMIETSLELEIEPILEEWRVPYLIHGKLSASIAKVVFGVTDDIILQAICYHTTLRANATLLDKVLFIADKLSWEPEHAPFQRDVREALGKSLDEAVGCFLTWTWNRRDRLEAVHPCLNEAWCEYRSKGFCKT